MKKTLILALIFIVALSAQVSTPTGFNATVGANYVTLSWNLNPESNIHSYHIYSDADIWGGYVKSVGKYTFNYTIENASPGIHSYRIMAESSLQERSSFTGWLEVTVGGVEYPEMVNYQDDSIVKMDLIEGSALIVPPFSGFIIKEVGNVLETPDGKLILTYTLQKQISGATEQYIYYSTSHIDDPENWTYGGRLNINRQLEDPYLEYLNGTYFLWAEDKTREKNDGIFSISRHRSTDLVTWYFDGVMLDPSDNITDWDGLAVYSPFVCYIDNKQILYFNGRNIDEKPHTEAIGYAIWDGEKFVKAFGNPIIKVEDLPGFNSIGVNEIRYIKDNYIMFKGGLFHYQQADQNWVAVNATSQDRINWEELNPNLIESPLGLVGFIAPYYTDKWNVIYQLSSGGGLYLGYPVADLGPIDPNVLKLQNAEDLILRGLDLVNEVKDEL